ncbi:MAG TPA: DNA gyrase inhibitor YacG [Caulobacteraceae bacterium]
MNSRPCPICGKPATARFRPFCSQRCADVDLHRWLSGGYSIENGDRDEDEPAGRGSDSES